jgi:hypothetical protein
VGGGENMKEKGIRELATLIKWGTEKSMPMCQGMAINAVIKEYHIPAKEWGYHFDKIGVKTNKQMMFWKDTGVGVSFIGIIDLDTDTVQLPAPLNDKEMEHLKKEENQDYHFFGEMDLDLSKTKKEISERACRIAEACGYMVTNSKDNTLLLLGPDEDSFLLYFDKDNKFVKVFNQRDNEEYKLNEIPAYGGYRGGF